MAVVNLLVAYPSVNDLSNLAQKIASLIGEISLEERESSNYLDGRYFSGHIGEVRVKISLSDEADHEDLPYWIALISDGKTETELTALADLIVKEKLLTNGFGVARFSSFGRVDEERFDY